MYSKKNAAALDDFKSQITAFSSKLSVLLMQRTVHILSSHSAMLKSIESMTGKVYSGFAELKDGKEDVAEAFIKSHGGEEAVGKVVVPLHSSSMHADIKQDRMLLEQLAGRLDIKVDEKLLVRTAKEGADQSFEQSQ